MSTDAVDSGSGAARADTPRWRRRLALAAAIALGLLLGLRLLLPTAIERGAAWAGPRYLGLPIRLANVDLALLRGEVVLEGLAIGSRADAALPPVLPPAPAPPIAPDPDPGSPDPGSAAAPEVDPPVVEIADPAPDPAGARDVLLGWDRVVARLDWGGLLARTVRLRQLEIEAPRIRLERGPDGAIDPLARARPTVPPAEPVESAQPEPDEPPGDPWRIEVRRFALRRPDVRLADAESELVLMELAFEELALEEVVAQGEALDVGGIALRDPVLRIRRDFVLAPRGARARPPAADASSAAPGSPAAAAPAPEPAVSEATGAPATGVTTTEAAGAAPPDDPEAPADAAAPPPGYRIARVAIDRAQFVWITAAGPVDVTLTLAAEGVTAAEGERFPVQLALEVGDGRLDLDGQLALLPPSYEGRLAWKALPFPPLLLAALPEFAPWLRSAASAADLQLALGLAPGPAGPPGVRLSGRVALESVALGDPGREEVGLGWKALEVTIRELRAPLAQEQEPAAPLRIDLERVRLVEPDVFYAQPTPALDALLGVRPPAPPGEPDAAAPAAEPDAAGTSQAAPSEPVAEVGAATASASAGTAPAGAGAIELLLGTLELAGGTLRFDDRRSGGSLGGAVEALDVEAGAIDVRVAGGATTAAVGSLAVAGSALRFEDERGAQPLRGVVEGLALALDEIALTPAAGAPSLSVGSLALDAKAISFEDHSVDPVYRGRLRGLELRAEGLRFPEQVARSLRAQGASAAGGRFELTGSLAEDGGEVRLELRQLALAPFSPYADRAAGYRIAGDASLKTTLRVRGSRYDTRNRIVLHDLDVSSRDPGDFEQRFGVPLDLALALLRDPTGNISLSIPVTIDEKGTRTGIGSIVAGALRQALLGALTSPLKILGSAASGVGGLVAGGGSGIEPIANLPGTTVPEPGQDGRYEGLVKLLAERPELAVRLRGRTGEADRPELAEQLLAERVRAGEGLPELADGAGFLQRRRLSGALADGETDALDPEDRAMLDRYVAAVQVPAEREQALARVRAEAVRDLAVAEYGIASDRLLLGDPAPDGAPGVVLELAATP